MLRAIVRKFAVLRFRHWTDSEIRLLLRQIETDSIDDPNERTNAMQTNATNWIKRNTDGSFDISDWTTGIETAAIEDLRWERVEGQVAKTLAATIRYADGRVFYGGVIAASPLTKDVDALRVENLFRQTVLGAALFAQSVLVPPAV